MIIGGAEDKLRQRTILTRFVTLAGGPAARILVISTASSLGTRRPICTPPVPAARRIEVRRAADDPRGGERTRLADSVRDVTGVFLTGGNQLRLSTVVGGTKLGRALVEAAKRGLVVAGSERGASAIASHMVAFGTSGATPKQRMTQMSAGLGSCPGSSSTSTSSSATGSVG